MLDGCVAIFRARGDTFIYVVGAGHENELLLDTVLEGLFVALTILLDGSIESRYVLSNLDIAARRAGIASSTRLQYVCSTRCALRGALDESTRRVPK